MSIALAGSVRILRHALGRLGRDARPLEQHDLRDLRTRLDRLSLAPREQQHRSLGRDLAAARRLLDAIFLATCRRDPARAGVARHRQVHPIDAPRRRGIEHTRSTRCMTTCRGDRRSASRPTSFSAGTRGRRHRISRGLNWSTYQDRHGDSPSVYGSDLAWSDTVNTTVGVRTRYRSVRAHVDLQYAPSPVPAQVGRSNYVDGDRFGVAFGADVASTSARCASAGLPARRLPARLSHSTKDDSRIVDELPDRSRSPRPEIRARRQRPADEQPRLARLRGRRLGVRRDADDRSRLLSEAVFKRVTIALAHRGEHADRDPISESPRPRGRNGLRLADFGRRDGSGL